MNSLNTRSAKNLAVLVAVLGMLASVVHAQTSLTNGVAVTGISGSSGSEKFYKIVVPSGQDELVISTSGGTGDVDLYVRYGSLPTTSSYDYRPYKIGNEETVTVSNPTSGTWYIMLKGYNAYASVTLLAEYSAATAITALTNSVPVTGLSGAASSELYFSIVVPASQTKLEISISGGTGDADLYVKRGALPTTSSYDYRPYLSGNNESVSINNPAAATWYIMVRGFNAFSGVTLLASYGGGGTGTLLENGVSVTSLAGAQASETLFRIEVPSGQTSLAVVITGGTGDADLYVKYGAAPTTSVYDYRPFLAGNEETVTITSPAGGTWYIMIRGYSAYTGLTLTASYGSIIVLQDGVAVTGLAGALNSITYYRIDVPGGMNVIAFTMSGGTGNADMYIKQGSKPTTSSYDYAPITSTNAENISIGSTAMSGSWYVMLKGTLAYSGVTLMADYAALGTVTALSNGVAVNGISGILGATKYYSINVPSGQTKLEFQMSGGTGDADLYVRFGSLPTTTEYDYRPYLSGNNESVTVNNPTAGTWYVMVRGRAAFSNVTLLATYGGTIPDTVTELQNGVAVTGIAGAASSETFYKIVVPASQTSLVIFISGGTGDVDLYVRLGAKPTTSVWDYRPYLSGNEETVTINTPTAGTYYIMLRGYSAYTGVTLKATYTGISDEVTELQNGVAVTGISGAASSEIFYKIVVPAGQDSLTIEMSGGTGDADMYVRKGSKPTLTSYDYRPYLIGNEETVEVADPAAATWYIMLRGYNAYSGVTLKATYGSAFAGNDFTVDPNAVAWWRFETGKLGTDTVGTNTLTNHGVVADTTNVMEGDSSADFEASEKDYLWIPDANLSEDFPLSSATAPKKISFACWMKLESFPITNYTVEMLSKATAGYALNSISYMVRSDGVVGFLIGYDNGTWWESKWTYQTISAGKWYHVVVTYQDSDRSYRINVWDAETGTTVSNTTGTTTNNISVTDAGVYIGARSDLAANRYFDGLLDEMVVFNDILTTAAIAKIRAGTYGQPDASDCRSLGAGASSAERPFKQAPSPCEEVDDNPGWPGSPRASRETVCEISMKATHPKKSSQPAETVPARASRQGPRLDWAILLYPASILAALAVLYVVSRSIERELPVPLDRGNARQAASTSDGSNPSASATAAARNGSVTASGLPLGQAQTPDGTAAANGDRTGIAQTATAGGLQAIDLGSLEGPARIAAMLRGAIGQNDHAMIKQCLEELVALGDEAVDSLVEMVNEQGEAGLWAAEALARIGTPAATVALLDTLGQTEEGQFKEDLATRVAGITNHESWPLLLDTMLQTEDATVARATGDALSRMADTPVMDEIIARYETATTEAEVERLARLVSNIECSQATNALLSLAGDVTDTVQDCLQQAAIDALSNIGGVQCVSYLLRRLEATTPGEGTSIYNAITQITSQEAYAQLLYAAAGNKEVSAEYGQTAAIEALANYPYEQTSALLERIVAEGANEKVVTAASRTLDSIQKSPYAITASAESLDKSAAMLPIAPITK